MRLASHHRAPLPSHRIVHRRRLEIVGLHECLVGVLAVRAGERAPLIVVRPELELNVEFVPVPSRLLSELGKAKATPPVPLADANRLVVDGTPRDDLVIGARTDTLFPIGTTALRLVGHRVYLFGCGARGLMAIVAHDGRSVDVVAAVVLEVQIYLELVGAQARRTASAGGLVAEQNDAKRRG